MKWSFAKWVIFLVLMTLAVVSNSARAQVSVTDSLALVAFIQSSDVEVGRTSWGAGPVPSWDGVDVRDGRVIGLSLTGNLFFPRISGTLPTAIGDLSALENLRLGSNALTGTIPESVGGMTTLRLLDVSGNQLSGPVPGTFGNLIDLELLYLHFNQFTELPASLSNLTKLILFFASSNNLQGAVPAFQNAPAMEVLTVARNQLDELPDLTALPATAEVDVQDNRFTFEDLELNAAHFDDFFYQSQDSVDTIVDAASSLLSVEVGGTQTAYQWHRSGSPVSGATGPAFTPTESGTYQCRTENPALPLLTIWSRAVRVEDPCVPGWQPRDDLDGSLPASVSVSEDCSIPAWLVRADPTAGDWAFKTVAAFLPPATWAKKAVSSFSAGSGALVAINAGFFGGTPPKSKSLIATGGSLLIGNEDPIERPTVNYTVTRATFGILDIGIADMKWTYLSKPDMTLFAYDQPSPNEETDPQGIPDEQKPGPASVWRLQEGIGGGPMLVKDGTVVVQTSWTHEVFFGGGIGNVGTPDPRTALGITDSGKLIFIVADGRCADGTASGPCNDGRPRRPGVSHQWMADMMLALGAKDAMNLDGGGSSTLVVGRTVINKPSDGGERPVVSAIALVPTSVASAVFVDSDDACCFAEEGTWIESSATSSFGGSPSRLNLVGTGTDRAVWRFPDISAGMYEVAAWWVPGPDRATNTPFTVFQNGVGKAAATVRVDQSDPNTENSWNILGTFTLSPGDSVQVTDDATGDLSPAYVVADGVRLVNVTPVTTDRPKPQAKAPVQSYPNPASGEFKLRYDLEETAWVELSLFDILGRQIRILPQGYVQVGAHEISVDATTLPSGLYVLRLEAGRAVETRRVVVAR